MIGRVARSFAAARLAPKAAERDRDGTYPLDEFGTLAELGLLAIKVPEELGGAGADNVGYVLAIAGDRRGVRVDCGDPGVE